MPWVLRTTSVRAPPAPIVPVSSRSNETSELVAPTWWTSTARTFSPATSRAGLTEELKSVVSSVPLTVAVAMAS